MLRSSTLIARAFTPTRSLALSLPLARALPSPSPSPSSVAPLSPSLHRLHATTRHASSTTRETTNLRASAGSGQGGKAEKAQARKDKEAARKERERARKEREKERARKQKDKAQRDKERAKAQRDKERAKAAADKLKERKLKLKEKEAKVKKPRTTSSLHPPKAPQNAWGIFLGDFIAEKKRSLAEGEKLPSVSILVKDATPQYQALSAEDKAALHERSEEQRRAYPDILNAWKATLTPDMIKEENAVRARRRKLGLSHKANLRLEGEPKKPVTAYILFSQEVRARGVDSDVLQGETDILEQSKLMAQAWRALSDEEKKRYTDAYAADKERYLREKAAFDAEQAHKTDST